MAAMTWALALPACAQEAAQPSVIDVLGAFPQIGQGRPPRAVETHQSYDCEGQRFDVRYSEQEATGDRMREVRLLGIGTPDGPLPQSEIDAVQSVLDPYWLMFSAPLTCRGGDFTIWFDGRRRDQRDNSDVRVSGSGLRVTNIQESGRPPLPATTWQRRDCDGRRFEVRYSEQKVGEDGEREVHLLEVVAPAGPLRGEEIAKAQEALEPLYMISPPKLECVGDDFSMSFEGRRRGQAYDVSVRVSGSGLRVTRITD